MSKTVNVQKLALLTNIPVSEAEAETFSTQLETTLDTIAMLEELDTKNIAATPQVIDAKNITRPDEIDTQRMFSQTQALANAKQTYNGYFVVPAVLQGE